MTASKERMQVLARFLRNQISLADRPPRNCVQLSNEEAEVCAEALEALSAEMPLPIVPDSVLAQAEALPGQ